MKAINTQSLLPALLFMLALASSPLAHSQPRAHGELGLLVEGRWRLGELHSEQSRWQAQLAVNTASEVARSVYQHGFSQPSPAGDFEDDALAGFFQGFFQDYSPHSLRFSLDSQGNHMGYLYGLPVAGRFSPVMNAAGTETSTGSRFIANPWVWVGAVAVGVAATSGGGGGSSSGDDSPPSGAGGVGRSTVGGSDCRIVDTSDGVNDATIIGGECLE